MYKQYLSLKPCKTGLGIFTSIDIPANVPIMEHSGTLYKEAEMPEHPANLQIGPDLFLGPSGDFDDYINHSCNPNCFLHIVGIRVILYSLYVISAGSELTFDYSTTSTDTHDKWKMNCACGTPNCRKIISGLQYLNQTTVDNMNKKGMLPLFITNPIFRNEP